MQVVDATWINPITCDIVYYTDCHQLGYTAFSYLQRYVAISFPSSRRLCCRGIWVVKATQNASAYREDSIWIINRSAQKPTTSLTRLEERRNRQKNGRNRWKLKADERMKKREGNREREREQRRIGYSTTVQRARVTINKQKRKKYAVATKHSRRIK